MCFRDRRRWVGRIILLLAVASLISFCIPSVYAAPSHPALSTPTSTLSWGGNGDGELGYVTPINGCNGPCQPSPAFIPPITGFAAITGGEHHTLALRNDGRVWSWGSDGYGELGNGQEQSYSVYTPQQVKGLTNVQAVAGGIKHSIALKHDGTVWTWGDNYYGQLGAPSHNNCWGDPCSLTPVQVRGPGGVGYLQNIVAVTAGVDFSLALAQDGTVWAWGQNLFGQLGTNNYVSSPTPVQVLGPHGQGVLNNVVAIASSGEAEHVLALLADGTVSAWGSNNFRQVGQPCFSPFCAIPYPVTVAGVSGVKAIAAGGDDSLALKSNGTLWGWGDDGIGQLGFNYEGPCLCTDKPTAATGLTGVTAVAASYQHTIVLRDDGTVWAAGNNSAGQLGLGQPDLNIHPIFAPVPSLHNVTGIGVTAGSTSMAITGGRPSLAASIKPYTLEFPTQAFNTTSPPQMVTVANLGTTPLVVSGASFQDTGQEEGCTPMGCGSLAFEFSIQGNPFPLSIPAGHHAQLPVVFTPVVQGPARFGPSLAFMVLATNTPKSSLAVDITGHAGPW